MATIKVAKVTKKRESENHDRMRIDAILCYYYPSYTMPMARKMPYIHKIIMLDEAKKLEAQKMYNLTQIVSTLSPGKKNSAAARKLSTHFKKIMKG